MPDTTTTPADDTRPIHDAAATMPPLPGPKAIVLFSDGTGNSSAKLFKTNVWRMYEAVDLGPAPPGKRPQISYYDDGVGTSGFKPLAVLGGAFGWGLRRNVLDIYKYVCRNYKTGDEIYGFGFSRGAFTMRLAVALIAAEGLVQSDREAELNRLSREAYRSFRKNWLPRKLTWPTRFLRQLRDGITSWRDRRKGRSSYDAKQNLAPPIRFVGVWDTVAAYGGPFAEVTRAIDNWIFPLSMPDYQLNKKVVCARHALALDDERDAFQPLLWDEVHEESAGMPAGRLQQVWFTGMHSDVGGGYPDESLSFVSLLWMMEEAEKAGLRTLDTIKSRFVALASSAGPIHDSRHGVGSYYRYQPRKIAAWLHPVDARTYSLRDPAIVTVDGHPKGLLTHVRVHESVVARIANGTDRYAPITLPEHFEVFPPQVEGENAPQPDSDDGRPADDGRLADNGNVHPMVSAALRARLAEPEATRARAMAMEAVWDLVWRRRVTYFVTVGLTLLLVTMPFWADKVPESPVLADGRTWIDGVLRLALLVTPAFLRFWVDSFADNPAYFLIVAALISALMWHSSACELSLRDRARAIWRDATTPHGPVAPPTAPTRLERIRTSTTYQRAVQAFKWKFLPNVAVTPVIAIVALWAGAALLTQIELPWLESGETLCKSNGSALPDLDRHEMDFSTRTPCYSVPAKAVENTRYIVEMTVKEKWFDGTAATDPVGLTAAELGLVGYLGVPFRRVIEARYLQPMIEIRQPPRPFQFDSVHIYPLEMQWHNESQLYRGEFTAPHAGELFVFANDSVSPIDPLFFYEPQRFHSGNHGTARLTIRRAVPDSPAMPAARRERAFERHAVALKSGRTG
ncbi:hypothetical protein LuPra_00831 [Luteitalea pratensis]|uniref:T6SS Phospholipase effector Tle1-like catalytic domain-containing protein n=1 Tax=Luteitalea pratensis TaxID=1855912 RepID=A0A143PGW3_LUTPR|nr:DUF2235 domain-containing protein [Luteitalea pratensis]AMY07656.1 hypothetical protein LuPra_00831 [Luteitalea pratensis]